MLLDPGFYHTHMKPILVDWLLLWLEAQQLAGITPDVTRRYLLGGYDDKEACAAVQALLQAEGRTEEDHHIVTRNVRLLNLGHDWLGSFMPHVLQKIDRVSFGIMTKQVLPALRAAVGTAVEHTAVLWSSASVMSVEGTWGTSLGNRGSF